MRQIARLFCPNLKRFIHPQSHPIHSEGQVNDRSRVGKYPPLGAVPCDDGVLVASSLDQTCLLR